MTRPGSALRLFVAIELPETWKQALQGLQDAMQAALDAEAATRGVRLRWVRPEGIHLTLKFLGEVAPERLGAIEAALATAVPRPPAIELSLGRAGSFSDRRAPRVVWAGIDESEPRGGLPRLVEQIETRLAATGFPRERRAFAPHLTLARLPDDIAPATREAIAAVTNALAAPSPSPLRVDGVSLMRSHLGRGGARYERLSSFPSAPLQP